MKYYFKIKNVDSTTYQQVKNISAALSTAQNTLPASFVLTFFTLLVSSEKFIWIIQRELANDPVEFLNEMQRVVALRLSWVSGIISVSKLPGVVSGRYIDPQLVVRDWQQLRTAGDATVYMILQWLAAMLPQHA